MVGAYRHLGCIADVGVWPPEGRIKPERTPHLHAQGRRAVDEDSLPPSEAGTLVGQFGLAFHFFATWQSDDPNREPPPKRVCRLHV